MPQELAYTNIDDVDEYAKDNGRPEWVVLSDDQKIRAIVESTEDILEYHQQTTIDGTLWGEENIKLIKAAKIQSIYIGQNQGNRDTANSMNSLSDGEFSDGVVAMSHGQPRKLDKFAQFLVDDVILELKEFGSGSFERNITKGKFSRA